MNSQKLNLPSLGDLTLLTSIKRHPHLSTAIYQSKDQRKYFVRSYKFPLSASRPMQQITSEINAFRSLKEEGILKYVVEGMKSKDNYWLYMAYELKARMRSFEEVLRENRQIFSEDFLAKLIKMLVAILSKMHQHQLSHNSLTLDNIFIHQNQIIVGMPCFKSLNKLYRLHKLPEFMPDSYMHHSGLSHGLMELRALGCLLLKLGVEGIEQGELSKWLCQLKVDGELLNRVKSPIVKTALFKIFHNSGDYQGDELQYRLKSLEDPSTLSHQSIQTALYPAVSNPTLTNNSIVIITISFSLNDHQQNGDEVDNYANDHLTAENKHFKLSVYYFKEKGTLLWLIESHFAKWNAVYYTQHISEHTGIQSNHHLFNTIKHHLSSFQLQIATHTIILKCHQLHPSIRMVELNSAHVAVISWRQHKAKGIYLSSNVIMITRQIIEQFGSKNSIGDIDCLQIALPIYPQNSRNAYPNSIGLIIPNNPNHQFEKMPILYNFQHQAPAKRIHQVANHNFQKISFAYYLKGSVVKRQAIVFRKDGSFSIEVDSKKESLRSQPLLISFSNGALAIIGLVISDKKGFLFRQHHYDFILQWNLTYHASTNLQFQLPFFSIHNYNPFIQTSILFSILNSAPPQTFQQYYKPSLTMLKQQTKTRISKCYFLIHSYLFVQSQDTKISNLKQAERIAKTIWPKDWCLCSLITYKLYKLYKKMGNKKEAASFGDKFIKGELASKQNIGLLISVLKERALMQLVDNKYELFLAKADELITFLQNNNCRQLIPEIIGYKVQVYKLRNDVQQIVHNYKLIIVIYAEFEEKEKSIQVLIYFLDIQISRNKPESIEFIDKLFKNLFNQEMRNEELRIMGLQYCTKFVNALLGLGLNVEEMLMMMEVSRRYQFLSEQMMNLLSAKWVQFVLK